MKSGMFAEGHLSHKGFTLVELSIVLVILGLLVGGVLTGQSLIRAAELRSITAQQQRFVTAINAFRDKYFAMPGDMSNAQSFWGVANATPSTCYGTAGTGTQTCNGDGDGKVTTYFSGSNEIFRFWQHLAAAGMLEGSYDGVTHGATSYSTTAANAPVGKLANSIWIVWYYGTVANTATDSFVGQYDNGLTVGGIQVNGGPNNDLFKPEDAWNIDTKLDDGKPATGRVVILSQASGLGGCTDAANNTVLSANYLLSKTTIGCGLIFRQFF